MSRVTAAGELVLTNQEQAELSEYVAELRVSPDPARRNVGNVLRAIVWPETEGEYGTECPECSSPDYVAGSHGPTWGQK